MGRSNPQTQGKRQREQAKREKRRAKDEKRAARKAAKDPSQLTDTQPEEAASPAAVIPTETTVLSTE
jgi:hypothetical protein